MSDLSPPRRTIGLVLIMIGAFSAAIALGFLEEMLMTGQPVHALVCSLVVIAGVLVRVVRPKPGPGGGEVPHDGAPHVSVPLSAG